MPSRLKLAESISSSMFLSLTLALSLFTATATALEEPPAVNFFIKEFKVTGNNPLEEAETQALLNRFTGEHFGLEGLQAAADELESRLRARGFAFYRVTLIPQELQEGIIEFEVSEFNIDQVVVEGNEFFSEQNILDSAPGLESGSTPNTSFLSRAINMANEQPSKLVKLTFSESESGAAIDAKLKVDDQNPDFFFFNLNNTGTDDTGEFRLTGAYNMSNLMDKDHNLTLTYTLSPDEIDVVSQFGAFYSIPDYRQGTKWSFFVADSDVETGVIGNTGLSISGQGTVLGGNWNKRLLQVGAYKQAFDVGFTHKAFETPDAFSSATSEIVSRPLKLAYSGSYLTTVYNLSFNIEYNMNISGGSNNEDADYLAFNCPVITGTCSGTADWSTIRYGVNYQRFIENWIVRVSLSGQQTSDQLISGEKYGVGGSSSVRGFEERSILGDSGMQFNIEAWLPAYTEYKIRPVIFFDSASVDREFDSLNVLDEDLASLGGGVRWSWKNRLNISADLGYVITGAGNVDDGDVRLHLDMFYRL